MVGRDSAQYHPPRNENGGEEGCGATTSHLKKITVRGHFARMENRCVTASLEHSLQAVQPRQRGKGIGGEKAGGWREKRERERERNRLVDENSAVIHSCPSNFRIIKRFIGHSVSRDTGCARISKFH